MCDCFHMVLPTWPGAPGSVSGRQLQPEEPEAETEEDHSVTEGPMDEIVRPRPQGSSPVYEYATEGAGFALLEDTPGRQVSSGRRRSWWKRDSGDSRTFSRMSHPEEATEVTLKTEVEAGASGYSVTGGGDQGIFVKQVMKDSSAAKLFSLREGDQLLSATIFFDDIKYEDALKILQYSEPYKVQFKVKRKLPARGDAQRAASGAQRAPKPTEKQDKDIADGSTDTPTKTMESDGDQERLISKPREGRGRRPQKDRLSWPKFQAMKSKHGRGPRRSHSSSEACERGEAPAVSPTSSDTEAQFPADEQEQKVGTGSQLRSRFLSLRFKVGSGKGPSPAGQPGRGAHGGTVQTGVLEEAGSSDDSRQDTGTGARGTRDDRAAEAQQGTLALSAQWPTQPGVSSEGALGGGADVAPRPRRKTMEEKVQEETVTHGKARAGPAPGQSGGGHRDAVHGLEMGTAMLPPHDTAGEGRTQGRQADFQIRIPNLKTPKFGFSKEKVLGTEGGMTVLQLGLSPGRTDTQAMEKGDQSPDTERGRGPALHRPGQDQGGAERDVAGLREGDTKGGDRDMEKKEEKMKMLKFRMPSFGGFPGTEAESGTDTHGKETDTETQRRRHATAVQLRMDLEGGAGDEGSAVKHPPKIKAERGKGRGVEGDISLGEKEVAVRDGKFKMPKFKMPSFGVSTPSKDLGTSVDVPVPNITEEVTLPCLGGEIRAPEGSVQLPSAKIELPGAEVEVSLPEAEVKLGELKGKAEGARFTGHLPKVQMPSIKMPKVDIKGPQVDITGPKMDLKSAKGEVTAPDVEMSVPSVDMDIQAPGAELEGVISLGDKQVATRDSRFKMPKFKMPALGVSKQSKSTEVSVDVSRPQAQANMRLPSIQADVKTSDLRIELPSTDKHVTTDGLGVKLLEGPVPEGELQKPATKAGIKGHMPKVQMPSIKMPKVDIRGPQVDIKVPQVDITGPNMEMKGATRMVTTPDVEVSLPSVEVDVQAPGTTLEGDLSLGDKEVASRDSKFKMPKFKMPSFSMSMPSKDLGTSVDVPVPKATGEVTVPSLGGEIQAPESSVQMPSAEIEIPGAEVKLGELKGKAEGARFKGHLPKLQMPSIKMPKVDSKGPQMDITGPKVDLKGAKGKVTAPEVEVSLPSVEVDVQAPGTTLEGDLSLGDKEVASRDSKFKMPKLTMPSFGVSMPSKDLGTSVDAPVPKVTGDVTLPCLAGEIRVPEGSVQLPSVEMELPGAEVETSLPEAEVKMGELKGKAEGARFKGHLPKVQMPSIKMPKVDIKGPQVDIKGPQVDITGPKMDLKGSKGEVTAPDVEMLRPSMEVDIQARGIEPEVDITLGEKEVATRDSRFKMPKFKMPSFGISTPSKSTEVSADISQPQVRADVLLPSIQADVKTSDHSIQLPSADVDFKTCELGVKLPEGELQKPVLEAGLKGHLPTVQMPSMKKPKVDFKGPQVDIKVPQVDITGPKLEAKSPKGLVTTPDMEVSLLSMGMDIQSPGTTLEGDISLGDKEVATRDSKFKMPKFKMPSFGMMTPSKDLGTSVDMPVPKATGEVTVPCLDGEIQAPEGSVQLPTVDIEIAGGEMEAALPDELVKAGELMGKAEGARFKGHLPKLQMPSIKMPKVDIKGPQMDITGPKVDLKGAKGKVTAPEVEVSLPSVEVDVQVPGTTLEGDLSLGDKEVASRDSKFKMPKLTMPSFGVSMPSKDLGTSVDAPVPKVTGDVTLPCLAGDIRVPEGSVQLPSVEIELPGAEVETSLPEAEVKMGELKGKAEGARFKGHLPKVQMPSIKMPKVDIKGPQVDIKGPQVDITGPKMDLKGAKGEVTAPDVEMLRPSMEVDIQARGIEPEVDITLGEKEVATRDSRFKMPKFKMPSFGISTPSKSTEISADISRPQVRADVLLPSIQADVKTSDHSIELPSANVDVKTGKLSVKLPEGELQKPVLEAGLKGHLPKVQMPSMKKPKVDFKGPQVDIKSPQVDITRPKVDLKGAKGEVTASDMEMSLPSMEVDIQAHGLELESDITLGEKEVATRDSRFKMPKFKMPSFGVSIPSKSTEVSADVSLPQVRADVLLPSIQADVKTSDLSIELPSADVDVKTGELSVKLPEGELQKPVLEAELKGHLSKVQMPSMKTPKVDFKGPQVDITGPKLEVKSAKEVVNAPKVEVSLPSMEVDIQAPGTTLEADTSLGDKEVATRDSKFKMPKFNMPSFSVLTPSKDLGTSVDIPVPKVTGEVTGPSLGGKIQAPEGSVQLPTVEIELPRGGVEVALPEEVVKMGELKGKAEEARFKGHLPKVQMPSIQMPKEDIKGPLVDITGTNVGLKDAKGKVTAPVVEMSLPSVEVDIKAPGAQLEGDITLGEMEVADRNSRFKMPKFKMPSFGVLAPSKSTEVSIDVSGLQVQADTCRPSIEADVKTGDLSFEQPSADIDVKNAELGVKLLEGQVPEGELQKPATEVGLKGHLPKVEVPSITMPKIDFKGPEVDIEGSQVDLTGPKVEMKSAKGLVTTADVEVSLPSMEVDIPAPVTQLEGDISLGDKVVAIRDTKFKIPKFKKPSFGMSTPSKDLGTSVDIPVSKVRGDVTLPCLGGDIQAPEHSVQLPSAEIELPGGEVEASLPEGEVRLGELKGIAEVGKFKGHMPKVQMPSIKMPKVDIKGPQVDITGSKMDLKGAKGEVTAPDVEMSLPSIEVDIQAHDIELEGNTALRDKDMADRDSRFKMSKFKMPSFSVSTPSKSTEVLIDVSRPLIDTEVCLPSIQADVKTSDLTIELPSAGVEVKTGELGVRLLEGHVPEGELTKPAIKAGLKGHLPKVLMPSMKMPKVDLKGPQVDIKDPQPVIIEPTLELKDAKGVVKDPDVAVSLPSVDVDIQATGAQLEGDISLGDKEDVTRDSKFKMPKFKMPSFSVSTPSKDLGTSVDVPVHKVTGEVAIPCLGGEFQTPEHSMQMSSDEIELPGAEVEAALPEAEVKLGELKGKTEGARFKGHLPKVQMPSIKMPKVDIKGPQVDITGPKVDQTHAKGEVTTPNVEMFPRMEVDIQAHDVELEGDITLGDKEVATRDSRFKMPKFKIPSFDASTPSKSTEVLVDVSRPQLQADVRQPSIQADIKTSDLSIELPSTKVDVKTGELSVKLPKGHVPEGELQKPVIKAGLKGPLPKGQMPSMKTPKVEFKGPQVDIKVPQVDITEPQLEVKGAKGVVMKPDMEVSLASMDVDIQAPGIKLEGDTSLGDNEVTTRDSKFKMPKFTIPSFGVSMPSKDLGTSVDMPVPKVTGEVTVPCLGGEIHAPEGSVQLPTVDIELRGGEVEVSLPEEAVKMGELMDKAEEARYKGHLHKVQMPSIKMPVVDIKGPQVDIMGPKVDLKDAKGELTTPDVEVSLPSMEVDIQTHGVDPEGDITLGEKEVADRESRFKMPKFKMPSFGISTPSKSTEVSVDVSRPKVQPDVCLPSIQADVKTSDLSTELPSADVEVKTGELGMKLPEGELQKPVIEVGLKGHLPKVQMPSMKTPKVDLKGPQVDIMGAKVEIEGAKGVVMAPDVDLSLPSVEVDVQAPGTTLEGDISLGDKEVATRDGKFKMPKFKMPSFGVSTTSKDLATSVDMPVPKVTGEVTLTNLEGEIQVSEVSMQLPTAEIKLPGAEVGAALPEAEVKLGELKGKTEGARFKGHLPKVQMPSIKMPKVDIKGPQVDIMGPKVDLKGTKGDLTTPDVEVSLPSMEVDIQAHGVELEGDITLGEKEVATRDSRFKMPKFKMPSFGVSTPSESTEVSADVSRPQVRADVLLPSIQADVKTSDHSIEVPSADVDVKTGELGVKLPERELQKPVIEVGLKGHLPKVQMPSMKTPKVDFKGPQVDITGPKLEVNSAKGMVTAPDTEVSLPGMDVDIQAPGTTVEGDISLGDKEMATRDSKFKMPKFKMPSFGMSTPSKDLVSSVDMPAPKMTGDVTLPCLGGEIRAPEGSVQLPSAEMKLPGAVVEASLPEAEVKLGELKGKTEGARFKGHLPKVQMPSIKMPKVDLKGPQVDITGHKLDMKGAKEVVTTPDMEVSLPRVEVDVQAPGTTVEGDISLGDKEVATRDSKFKMPKFKMPSFGMSTTSKDLASSVDMPAPKVTGDVTLPCLGGEIRAPEGSFQLPSAEIELPGAEVETSLPEAEVKLGELKGKAEGARFKGHLPKVQMPSIKMPKVDVKGPLVDIKGPKMDLKCAKGAVTAPDVEMSLPSMEVDIQARGVELEGDIALGDKEVDTRDSKFKMPKFKMPSFSMAMPSKATKSSVDVTGPAVQPDVRLPSIQADIKTSDLNIKLPSADVDIKTGELGMKFPEVPVSERELQKPVARAGLKAHLPKVHMPSMKMPKVDFKGPQGDIKVSHVDITGPTLEVKGSKGEVTAHDVDLSLPGVEVDIRAPVTQLEGDLSLGDKEVATRDSKFKKPKFKMPSFGVTMPSKDLGTSVDAPVPKVTGEVTVPCLGGKIQAPEGSVQLPTVEIELPGGEVEAALPKAEVKLGELKGKAEGARFKGHLPKVQMPSIKMPKVDSKGLQVDIKGPKMDLKSAKGEVTAPDVEMSLPSMEVDIQAHGVELEGDIAEKEVDTRDSKFKMPKFKMPSFGMVMPSKSTKASVDVTGPAVQADVRLPSIQADVKTSDLSIELPSVDMDVRTGELGVKLPEGPVPERELQKPVARAGLKGHLPKVQMPSIKMPKVDLKGPQVDITGHKPEMMGATGVVTAPDMAVSLPSMEVDVQAPGTQLEGDLSLGDKEVASRDSKFKMPKFKMPSFGVSMPSKDLGTSVDVPVPKVPGDVTLPCLGGEIHAPEGSVQLPSAEMDLPGAEVEAALPEGGVRLSELKSKEEGARFKGHLPKVQMPSIKMPKVDIKGPQVDLTGPKVDLKGVKGEVTAPDMAVSLPSVELDTQAPGTQLEGDIALEDQEVSSRSIKFKMPKVSMPFSRPSPSRASVVSSQVPGSDKAAEVTRSPEHVDPAVGLGDLSISTVDVDGGPPGEQGGGKSKLKKSHFKMPKVFSPPGKSAKSPAAFRVDSGVPLPGSGSARPLELGGGGSLREGGAAEEPAMPVSQLGGPGVPSARLGLRSPHAESSPLPSCEDVTLTEYQVTLPRVTISPELPQGTVSKSQGEARLSSKECTADLPSWERVPLSQTDSPGPVHPLFHISYGQVTFPKFHRPKFGFSAPEEAGVEGAPFAVEGALSLPKDSLSLGDGSKGQGPGDGSASQPQGAATAPATGDPLQASGGAAFAAAPTVGSAEGDAAAGAEGAGSQEGWFRMPSLRLPSFWRSSRERAGAQAPASATSAPRQAEAAATAGGQGVCDPGSEAEAAVSSQPPEAEVAAADVLRRTSDDGKALKLQPPPAGTSAGHLPTSEVQLRPGREPLPLQMPSGRLSETDRTPAREAERTEHRSPPAEGPLRLKASRTDVPAQISVVDTGQLWEDSVLTVKFPTLKVPRFTFPAPSSEADVFIPAVREVWCADSSLDQALREGSPGVWDASVLKAGAGVPREQPAALDLPSEAPPISKVRVHIQGARVESQEVAIHSRVIAEFDDLSGPGAVSTQIVRESEVPASDIQRPSYGFSLLKGKVAGRLPRAQVHVVTQDSGPPEGGQEAPKHASPGAGAGPGELQPDTGEPFEMISSSLNVPGPQPFTFEVRSGPQFADSCSDEEPVELEFPPEDGREASAPLEEEGGEAEEKPESKRSSGLFRFWLPNIGFSSSAEETGAGATEDAPRPAPVQTQPEARPGAPLPKKQEKAGWFRFPKLGFSSSPTKKSQSSEDGAGLAEPKLQEEAVAFFDARESFSPEEKEDGGSAEAAGPSPAPTAMVTSAARTELALLEQGGKASDEPAPRPAAK